MQYKGFTITVTMLGWKDFQAQITSPDSSSVHLTIFEESRGDAITNAKELIDLMKEETQP